MEKFRLEVAIEKAIAEFNELEESAQSPLNVMMLARKYAPATIKQCMDILGNPDYQWIYVFEGKPGYLLLDIVISTTTSYIAASIEYKVGQAKMQQQMDAARNETVRSKLLRP